MQAPSSTTRANFTPSNILASTVIAAAALAIAGTALAQQPPASKEQPKKAAPKEQPKPKAAAPKEQPKGAPPPQAAGQPQINFTPWTKLCQKASQDPNAKQVCVTGRDGRVESGMPVAAAMLIEPEGEPKKVLRITLPLGVALQPGSRATIDQGQPMQAPYVICFQNGCVADYEASQELVNNMKKGTGLVLQAMGGNGQGMSIVIPLADFGKIHDGPPIDPKVFEEQQKKLQEEQQKRMQQLQQQQQQPPPGR